MAVGDVMLGRWIGAYIGRLGVDSPFDGVRAELRTADIAVGNLECALTGSPISVSKAIALRASPSVLPGLKRSGLSVLSLANNHAGDCGQAGIDEARRLLKGVGIVPLGPTPEPVVVERNGLRLGFVPLLDLPSLGTAAIEQLRGTVRALRRRVDVVVASIHWGIEGDSSASPIQRRLARQLATMGVDLILGSHPHVLQPIRWIPGVSGRRCLVAYSLGNFVFDTYPGKGQFSEILSLTLGRHGVEGYRTLAVRLVAGYPKLAGRR